MTPHVRFKHFLNSLVGENLWLSSNHWLNIHFFICSSNFSFVNFSLLISFSYFFVSIISFNISVASFFNAENFLNIVFISYSFFDFFRILFIFLIVKVNILPIKWALISLRQWLFGMVSLLAWSRAPTYALIFKIVRGMSSIGGQIFVI